MTLETVTEQPLKNLIEDNKDAWKRGLKSNQEGPAFQLLNSVSERTRSIDAYRREVSQNILTMFNELGRDLEALRQCYETRTGFFEAIRKSLGLQQAQVYRVMQVHKDWKILIDGMAMLPASQSITTLTQAVDFVKEIRKSGLADAPEPETEEEIETSAEKFGAACRRALNRTEKGTPTTKNVHSRVLPTLRKLVNPDLRDRGLVTKDEQVRINELQVDLMQIIGRIEEREKDAMADLSGNERAEQWQPCELEAAAHAAGEARAIATGELEAPAVTVPGAVLKKLGPADIYPGTKDDQDQARLSLEQLEKDIAAAGNATNLARKYGWSDGDARKQRFRLGKALRGLSMV